MLASFYKKEHNYQKVEEVLTKASTDLADSKEIKAALADLYFDIKKYDERARFG